MPGLKASFFNGCEKKRIKEGTSWKLIPVAITGSIKNYVSGGNCVEGPGKMFGGVLNDLVQTLW